MEKRKEWLEVRSKVAKLHPAMLLSLDLMDDDLSRAARDADACDGKGIGFALEVAKRSVSLRKDAEHLRAAAIMDEETYLKFTYELATYVDGTLTEIADKLTTCICHKGAPVTRIKATWVEGGTAVEDMEGKTVADWKRGAGWVYVPGVEHPLYYDDKKEWEKTVKEFYDVK